MLFSGTRLLGRGFQFLVSSSSSIVVKKSLFILRCEGFEYTDERLENENKKNLSYGIYNYFANENHSDISTNA